MPNKIRSLPLPRYGRVTNPPSMHLTERDKHILQAILTYDGLLSFSQIQRLFFTGKSQAELRLRLLYQQGYLGRPDQDQRRRIPEMVYWLDRRGAELVASLNGVTLGELGWRKEPRWFQVEHDLALIDFRLDLEQACRSAPQVAIETWYPESEFHGFPDKVSYTYNDYKFTNRSIIPDSVFILTFQNHRIRYLLEIDRGTEDNPRFLREKILPGLAYIRSQAYQQRFGHRSGRWLVVTTGEHRLKNMLSQAKHGEAQGLFYFTTYNQLSPTSVLFDPIWRRADREDSVPMLFLDK
jgi:hypothetical protein